MLSFYELDFGLNNAVRRCEQSTHPKANMLLPVPGGAHPTSVDMVGPSGVLVCCEGEVVYQHVDRKPLRLSIPRSESELWLATATADRLWSGS